MHRDPSVNTKYENVVDGSGRASLKSDLRKLSSLSGVSLPMTPLRPAAIRRRLEKLPLNAAISRERSSTAAELYLCRFQ